MWDNEQSHTLRGNVERLTLWWPLHGDHVRPERFDIEVDLPRPPAPALPPSERTLDVLEADQQLERGRRGITGSQDVEQDDGIVEFGLVVNADRCCHIEARHCGDAGARQPVERMDGVTDRPGRVTQIRAKADRHPNRVVHCSPILAAMLAFSACAPRRLLLAPQSGRREIIADAEAPDRPEPGDPTRPVAVRILVPPRSGTPHSPLGWLESARALTAERHAAGFRDLGAIDVRILSEPTEGRTFGERLRDLAADVLSAAGDRQSGLIVLGGGSMPLARREDRQAFLTVARGRAEHALANSWFSSDAIAVPDARLLAEVPDLPADNALPRWLTERAGVSVADLRGRRRLAMDLDSPLDVLLLARGRSCPPALATLAGEIAGANERAGGALDGVAATLADRRGELLVAGRTSARTLTWLERNSSCRVRALVEERGLRAATALALGDAGRNGEPPSDEPRIRERAEFRLRPPRSVLGMMLDERGPETFGSIVAELGDAAIVDTRVLLAHRLGSDEAGWPPLADRLASDLLRSDEVADSWLRALTASAVSASIPVLLGGHTLVGPGLPLLASRA